MISVHPSLDVDFDCPHCERALEPLDWVVPGMRTLAELACPSCGREYYGDLPTGHGLHYPMLLDREDGTVHGREAAPWFAESLHQDYTAGQRDGIDLTVEGTPTDSAVFLNCLDRVFGHGLLKLFNAQHHLDTDDDRDLVVLVPDALRWLVPDEVTSIWTVDWPLDEPLWSDELVAELRNQLTALDRVELSPAFPLPPSDRYDVERFSGIQPFPIDEWAERAPTVTVIWRSDRGWIPATDAVDRRTRLAGYVVAAADRLGVDLSRRYQHRRIAVFASALRDIVPDVDLAVAGVGDPGGLPGWIDDRRTASPDEATERALCNRYAASHVVVGVHGSNMILPSAHAGGVVDLVARFKWGNLSEDLTLRTTDARQTLFQYRNLPRETPPALVASVVASMLRDRGATGWHKTDSATAPTWEDAYE
jgi:hypothetical protein